MEHILGKLLKKIGSEVYDQVYTDAKGTIRPISNDERLARLIFRQALGYEEETENPDGSMTHRVFSPDVRMQQFIIERREGRQTVPQDDKAASILDTIREITKSRINKIAEEAVEDKPNDNAS